MRDIRTTVIGNATKDPTILRGGADPFSVVVRIAVTSRYFDPDSRKFEDRRTEYFNVFVRRQLARHVLRSVHKGDPLIVSGRLGSSEWTREDGEVAHALTIQAEAIGHDLTFGATQYTRRDFFETPDTDPKTGVVLPELAAADDRADDELAAGLVPEDPHEERAEAVERELVDF